MYLHHDTMQDCIFKVKEIGEEGRGENRAEMCFANVPTPHEEYDHYVLQTILIRNKNKNTKNPMKTHHFLMFLLYIIIVSTLQVSYVYFIHVVKITE